MSWLSQYTDGHAIPLLVGMALTVTFYIVFG